jgi:hypothetical protein
MLLDRQALAGGLLSGWDEDFLPGLLAEPLTHIEALELEFDTLIWPTSIF